MRPIIDVVISGWGSYIPRYRVSAEEIAKVWGKSAKHFREDLLIDEKAVAGQDEDVATIAVEAAKNAIKRAGVAPSNLGAIFVGSESKPYAVKPTGTIVAEALGATPRLLAADLEFACKAGTEAIQCCIGLVGSGMIDYGMAIGADTAQGAPADALEFSAGCGGTAIILGRGDKDTEPVAKFEASVSYVTDTPDFWRRPKKDYPSHAEAFTGEPAYFQHVISAGKLLMEELSLKPEDFSFAVFHQPNGKFPIRAAKLLGFKREQIEAGFLVPCIGNLYAGSSVTGLSAVLDIAKPGDRIFLASFGSGAGSDAFSLIVGDGITSRRNKAPKVSDYIRRKKNLEYSIYAKMRRKIVL
ncbi:MAG: hydroxymethylglutaryl-CoA synthase [Candidatus Verstraetearchaeota archaeon]|nr:hydroxymethylglutaryl-CoA synthase [Candidatus Verstraetearchaeota archaeon]